MKIKSILFLVFFCIYGALTNAQSGPKSETQLPLSQLQQQFVDLRFGMFIHFNIPTYTNVDWPDPETDPALFNPVKLDAMQWAKAAKAANMTYGCLTTKHHSGFCIWDTKTTDYSIKSSPYKKDVVKQFTDAFRAEGLKVMLYYSILDTHHKLRPGTIVPKHIKMVKQQITELLTNYGKVEALVIDGWDAPWSRISYDEIPFEEIYKLVKSLQPNCLLMDLNGAKYPAEGLYYTDIKTYEMGAGQRISEESNKMPALACLPINGSWFWKTDFPTSSVRDPKDLVNNILIPLNKANCNFILNVAPNKEGLIDDNAVIALKTIGQLWENVGPLNSLDPTLAPIISPNLAKNAPANSSWSQDADIMDYATDDNFGSSWQSNPLIKEPWFEIDFKKVKSFNTIVVFERNPNIKKYILSYLDEKNKWIKIFEGENISRVKVTRFNTVKSGKVRMQILSYTNAPSIAEFQVYNEAK